MTIRLLAFGFLLAALAFAAGWWLGPSGRSSDHSGHAHAPATGEADSSTVWTCSMHPQVRQPHPGSCPLCGMDLIPLAEEADDEERALPRLRLSERSVALMQIRVAPAERRPASSELRLPGRIAADERQLRVVASWFGGRVDRLLVNVTGQRVTAGQALLELYSPELFGVQEEFLQAAAAAETRRDDASLRLLEGARDRLRLLGLVDEQIAAIRAAGRPQTHLAVHSPADGFVLERQVSLGQYVDTGTPLFTVADLSTVWAELEAFESQLAFLKVGDPTVVEIPALPGQRLEGEIAFIDPIVDGATRTARVRVDLSNADLALKPGMLATGQIRSVARFGEQDPLVIPASAPLFTGERSLVYVKLPGVERPAFEARSLTLGPRLGDVYPVLDGDLSEGEQVVVNGQFKLDSELQIRGRPSMMAPSGDDAGGSDDHAYELSTAGPGDPRRPPQRLSFASEAGAALGEALQPALDQYLDFAEALADDDAARAAAAIGAMESALEAIDPTSAPEAARESWNERYERLERLMDLMLQEPTLAVFRAHLQELTLVWESLYANFGGDALSPVNRAFCPMVNDSIGTWLQRGDTVRNPYWGAAMLGCGEIYGSLGGEDSDR